MAIFENVGRTLEDTTKTIYQDIFQVRADKIVPHIKPEEPGLPDMIKDGYDNMLHNAGKSLWQGMVKAAGTGFGKGVLLAAAVLILGSGLGLGIMASTGVMTMAVTHAPILFSTAFLNGAAIAMSNLTTGGGLLALVGGGAIGAAVGIHNEQKHISAEVAKTQANDYELMRRVQAQRARAPQQTVATNNVPDNYFRDREMQRRSEAELNPTRNV